MSFSERWRQPRPVLLDGPMGTELDRRGVDTSLPLWSARGLLVAPETVLAIHRDYLDAGAEILTTNTFRTHARSLATAGLGNRARELTALAVQLAREAVETALAAGGEGAWVAGSIAPLEDCYSPELTPADVELEREHAEIVEHLEAAGVDLYLVETMPTVREAEAAARAALATGKPVLVGFTCDRRGALLSGESVADAARRVGELGVAGLLINCTPAACLHVALERLARATRLPVGAYGNVGHAESERGWAATDVLSPARYAAYAERWLRLGARLIGSCCGTGPEHIRALRRLLAGTTGPAVPAGG